VLLGRLHRVTVGVHDGERKDKKGIKYNKNKNSKGKRGRNESNGVY
jgi:hypothetical protein